MNWYIGQEVVSLHTDHEQAGILVNEVYTITGIRSSPCKCPRSIIDVGFAYKPTPPIMYELMKCTTCGVKDIPTHGIRWYGESCFAPLLSEEQEADFEDAIREPEYATL